MNRAQRRKQIRTKSNLRKAGLTYLTVAGVVTGTYGLASPAQAALTLTPTNCSELEMDLTALEVAGGTVTANFTGDCDFAEVWFREGDGNAERECSFDMDDVIGWHQAEELTETLYCTP